MKDSKGIEITEGAKVQFLDHVGTVYYNNDIAAMGIKWGKGTPNCINDMLWVFYGSSLEVIK